MSETSVRIHPSWSTVLHDEFEKPYFKQIKKHLVTQKEQGIKIYPPGNLIFNAFNSTPFEEVRVVILGQDPYHNPGEAMGLSFSVPPGIRIPPSLLNIQKELQKDLEIVLPNHGDLTPWASQGVFLLNAILTVAHNQPASHKLIGWEQFTDEVIKRISELRTNVVFMLWGNFAKNKTALIDQQKHLVLTAAHPSPLARGAFFGSRHFSKANQYFQNLGQPPIDWHIPNI